MPGGQPFNPLGYVCGNNIGSDYTDEERIFLTRIDRWRTKNRSKCPDYREVLRIILALGYRKQDRIFKSHDLRLQGTRVVVRAARVLPAPVRLAHSTEAVVEELPQPTAEELEEFRSSLDRYKRRAGRPHPTWREVLAVVHRLGYRRPGHPDPDPDRVLGTPPG